MIKLYKKIVILLCIVLITPVIVSCIPFAKSVAPVEAATVEKVTLGKTKGTIGVGSSSEYLNLENANNEASYTYSSANTKIATVSEYGDIQGISKGKTVITVEETYKGIVTKVGTYKVSVVTALLSAKSIEVGVNNYIDMDDESMEHKQIKYINLHATYQYKTSNSSIATVNKYGFVSGVKLGKTTISVTETYKRKTTKLGSFTVNVVGSKLLKKKLDVPIGALCEVLIDCKNTKATYTYKSSNTKIAKVNKGGFITGLKEGITYISVTETYKKVTNKLGYIKVTVSGSYINPDVNSHEFPINSSHNLMSFANIYNQNYEAIYTCKSADTSIITAGYEVSEYGYLEYLVKAVGLGSTTLTVYDDYNGVQRIVGIINITVKEYPVTSFEFGAKYFEGNPSVLSKTYYLNQSYSDNSLVYYLIRNPYPCTTPITYASSDETIATIDCTGVVTPIREGIVEITATCGSFSDTIQAIIK